MDTDILQEFAELAKRLNFTETARLLDMSQPTLSKHISSFERELRIELFDRSGADFVSQGPVRSYYPTHTRLSKVKRNSTPRSRACVPPHHRNFASADS